MQFGFKFGGVYKPDGRTPRAGCKDFERAALLRKPQPPSTARSETGEVIMVKTPELHMRPLVDASFGGRRFDVFVRDPHISVLLAQSAPYPFRFLCIPFCRSSSHD